MISEQERQVRLQFLEEAIDYINSIESGLQGLGSGKVTGKQLDAIMRAAHSIKGGAAMMSYTKLAAVGHRLEDFFKILQYDKKIELDGEIERLMLEAVDRLRYMVKQKQKGKTIDDAWVKSQVNPCLDRLHERLGDLDPEGEANLLAGDSGEDILSFLFESEVERCLTELEELVATGERDRYHEQLQIAAEEMGGLAEMIELPAFASLCQSVLTHTIERPQQVEAIIGEAISAWRRTQAMVLIGQMGNLPERIELTEQVIVAPDEVFEYMLDPESSIYSNELGLPPEIHSKDLRDFNLNLADVGLELEIERPSVSDFSVENLDRLELEPIVDPYVTMAIDDSIKSPSADNSHFEIADMSAGLSDEDVTGIFNTLADFTIDAPAPTKSAPKQENSLEREAAELLLALDAAPEVSGEMQIGGDETEITAVSQQQAQAANQTIRVSVKQLEQISDLFSTLTIERNGLNQQLVNVRQLVSVLQNKVQQLEASNLKLRSAYDDSSSAHSQSLTIVGAGVADVLNIAPQAPHTGVNYGDFDALEFDRYGELHLLSQEVMDTIVQVEELTSDIDLQLNDTERTNRDLNRTAKEIQSGLTTVRMRPVNDLLDRFPRALKNLAIEHGKPIDVKIRGGSTLIERSILENLNDPLMHLIRNAFDHGIERPEARLAAGKPAVGTIELSAGYRGNQTVITIKDDGGGINLDKIRAKVRKMGIDEKEIAGFSDNELLELIFEPGFSTAEKVTDLSGRGVGMDVVRTNIRELRGDIQVDTKLGAGSTFTITVPLTLSVVRVLLVDAGGTWMAIPSNMVEEIVLLEPEAILETGGQHLLQWEEMTLRLIDPAAHFYHSGTAIFAPTGIPQIDRPLVLTIDRGTDTIALKVDRFWGEQEVAIRQPEGNIQLPPGFTGFTILGDGRIVPLVDAIELIRSIDRETALTKRNPALSTLSFDTQEGDRSGSLIPLNPAPVRQRPLVLIIDDSINVRRFLALTLEKAGYQVEQAKDGQDAVDKLQGGLKPKAAICDIEMPRMDGYGFLSNIKGQAKYKDLPVLMLTSRSGEKHRKIAMNLGATGYFSKPFKEVELLSTLDGLVKK